MKKVKTSKVKGKKVKVEESEEPEEPEEDVPDPEMEKIVVPWLTAYYTVAKKIAMVGYTTRPMPSINVVSSEKERGTAGFYRSTDNSILINTLTWMKKDRAAIIKTLKKRDALAVEKELQDNHVWRTTFYYTFPASTLSHEMEHYRRKTAHDSGGHNSTREPIFPGDSAPERTFEESANVVYDMVLKNGLYDEFFKLLKL